jgi:HEXXH motif-containing protein
LDLTCPAVLPPDRIRSSSHSMESHFGALWATVNSAPGLAQSIVHEMAHQKLWTFGVSFESAGVILANDPSSLYWSPLVAWPRPLAAVLHAHYALLHIAALDCALLTKARSRAMRAAFVRSAIRHLQLLSQSASVLRKHAIVDESGAPFFAAMWDWMGRVRQEAGRHAG